MSVICFGVLMYNLYVLSRCRRCCCVFSSKGICSNVFALGSNVHNASVFIVACVSVQRN